MGKVLTQQEIDAMVRATRRAKAPESGARQQVVRTWDFRAAGQLANEKARAITGVHESFARNLTRSLGAYLRVPFEAALMTVEQVSYREFMERVPELAYTLSLQIKPADLYAALHLDNALVFSIVDVLLGGTGESQDLSREISEIEEHIMERVAGIICTELQSAWQPSPVEVELQQRQQRVHVQQFMPPTEKVLVLSFELTMSEVRGMLNLVFPASVSKLVVRDVSRDRGQGGGLRSSANVTHKIQERLLRCTFSAELGIPSIALRVGDVLKLKEGDVIDLKISAAVPASLLIGGRGAFQAVPVRFGSRRAAQIGNRVEHSPQEERLRR